VSDEQFRAQLLSNPKEALVGYDLTAAERDDMENLTPDAFEMDQSEMEDRISRGNPLN